MSLGRAACLIAWIFLAATSAVWGQTPIGPELRVNDQGLYPQVDQAAGVARDGSFLVTWQGMTPGRRHDGLWGQWYTPEGTRIGQNHALLLSSSQIFAAVLGPGAGEGVTAYYRRTYLHEGWDNLVSREVLPDGSWAGPRQSLASLTQLSPRFVRPLPRGGSVIALIGPWKDQPKTRTWLLFTDEGGRRMRGPSLVFPARHSGQYVDGLAVSPSGRILVTFTDSGAKARVLAQLFSSEGRPLGPAFPVHSDTPGRKFVGRAAPLGDQGFVVVWIDEDPVTGGLHLRMRLFDPSGVACGPEQKIDDEDGYAILGENLDADAQGNFFVVWEAGAPPDDPSGNRSVDVWGRLYRPDGRAVGPKRVLNTHTAYGQTNPYVVAGAHGTFIVVWQSWEQDGDREGIFGQVFAGVP